MKRRKSKRIRKGEGGGEEGGGRERGEGRKRGEIKAEEK
jgi:hypothetical protein